jgi:FMN phosphatase YigB (HAD superfamily)
MLWRDLLTKVRDGSRDDTSSKQVIRFFDIDGTLIKLPAEIHLIDTRNGETVVSISQEEFAEHPEKDYWVKRASRSRPDIPAQSFHLDFGDFNDPSKIASLVQDGTPQNKMFKSS